jgi:hypothetical protein
MSTGPQTNAQTPAAAEKDAKRKEAATESADYALPESGAYSLVSLALVGDISVANNRPKAFVALQRLAGNRAVAGSFLPPPNSNGHGNGHSRRGLTVQRQAPAPASSTKSFGFQGVTVSSDPVGVRQQLEALIERGGLKELRRWYAAWSNLDTAAKQAVAGALDIRPEEVAGIDATVAQANEALEDDARTYVDGIKPDARKVTEGILDDSAKAIESELEKYGIREKELPPDPGSGGAEGAPPSRGTELTFDNQAAGRDAQASARSLAATRRTTDKAMKDFLKLAGIPGYSEIEKIVQKEIPELDTKYKQAEELWKMQEDIYAAEAQKATSQFPVLAIYAAGADAAGRLDEFAKQPIEKLGETIWRESKTRLDNIETVRGGLDGKFNPLQNERITALVLGKAEIKPWQKKVGQDYVADVRDKIEQDKMFWSTIAIGLGLIAALPTGGTSLVATGIVTAAGIAGAALSVYNAYDHFKDYQLQSAASKTAYAKAESLSKDEPEFLWLALEIVGAIAEVGAAAVAFKGLVKAVKEARETRNILKAAETIDAIAPAGAAGKVKATVAGELGPQAVNDLIKAEGATFRAGDLVKIHASLERSAMEEYAALYKQLANEGRVRPLTEEGVEAVFGHLPARDPLYSSLADELIQKDGILKARGYWFDYNGGVVFLKPGSQDTVANWVVHEITHTAQSRLKSNLSDFWAEFEAFSAQKRMLNKLDKLGLGGQVDASVTWLREADDATIALHLKNNYGLEIPKGVGGFVPGEDKQMARAAMQAMQKVLKAAP